MTPLGRNYDYSCSTDDEVEVLGGKETCPRLHIREVLELLRPLPQTLP